jgi:hypothetical protein
VPPNLILTEEQDPPVTMVGYIAQDEVVQRVPAGRAERYSPMVVIAPNEKFSTGHERISLLSVHVLAADSRSGVDI